MTKAAEIQPVESKVEKPKAEPQASGKTIAGLPVLSVHERTDHVNALIYGDPGAGKTRLAASAFEIEAMRPILIIDIEGGTKSVRNLYPDIDVIRVKSVIDAKGRIKDSAWDQFERIYDEAKKGDLAYTTFIIDSLTELYWVFMEHHMREVVIEHEDRDPDIPAQRDWGKASARIKRHVRRWRDLENHVIFTALKATVTKGDGKDVRIINYTPSLPGKLAYDVTAFVDEVFYLYTKTDRDGTQRMLLTENANKYLAKDRSNNLPQTMTNPTWADLAEAILD